MTVETSLTGNDRVVAREPNGAPLATLARQGVGFHAATTDASGNLLLQGMAAPNVDFGCGPPFPNGPQLVDFALKLGPDLTCIWQRVVSTGGRIGYGIGRDPTGDVFLSVRALAITDDFGTGPIGGLGNVALRLSGIDGSVKWARLWGPGNFSGPHHVYSGGESLWLHSFPLPRKLIHIAP